MNGRKVTEEIEVGGRWMNGRKVTGENTGRRKVDKSG